MDNHVDCFRNERALRIDGDFLHQLFEAQERPLRAVRVDAGHARMARLKPFEHVQRRAVPDLADNQEIGAMPQRFLHEICHGDAAAPAVAINGV